MSNFVDNFNTDFQQLQDDANTFAQVEAQLKQDVTAYQTAYQKLLAEKDPSLAYMMLFYLLSQQGFKQLDDQLAYYGAGLKIQGDMTKLNNDLQNITNQNSSDVQLLKNEASHLDQMLDVLSPDSATAGQNMNVQDALGSTATAAIYQEFLTFRQNINWAEDPHAHDDPNQGYNPNTLNPNPPASGPRTYYFDVDGNGYITNFADLQKFMSEQGDPDQANEAYKSKTDVFNTNTSTTQSTNAASNALITNQKNITTEIQSFVTDMMHAQSDVVSASVKAMTAG